MDRFEELSNLQQTLIKAARGEFPFFVILFKLQSIKLTFDELVTYGFIELIECIRNNTEDEAVQEHLLELSEKWRLEVWAPAFTPKERGTCGICGEKYFQKLPKASWCGHVFCQDCIKDSLENAKEAMSLWKCPLCKLLFDTETVHSLHL